MDNIQNETVSEGTWPITELEMAARDMLDIGFWESAEDEERAGADTVPTAPTSLSPAGISQVAYTVDD